MPWPTAVGGRAENAGATTSTSGGTVVTAHATVANSKGSYAQLIASTAFDAYSLVVMLANPNGLDDYLVDIAIGAAASEQVILPNLSYSTGNGEKGVYYIFPIYVPAGTRIAAAVQCTTANRVIDVSVMLLGTSFLGGMSLGRVEAIGVATADSGGTAYDTGGTANTKNGKVEISAATGFAYRAIIIAFPSQNHGAWSNVNVLFDVLVGAAGSEQVILPNININISVASDSVEPHAIGPFPVDIPAGTRVSVEAQSNNITVGQREFDFIIYGIG